jgi:hypothetical protein
MARLIRRSVLALVMLIVGLILQALGVAAGAVVAGIGLIALVLINLVAPWPWQRGWRR